MKEILERCLAQALELRPEEIAAIPMDEDLTNHGLFSINLIRLILLLEEALGITVRDEDLRIEKFLTVNNALETLAVYAIE